jgi:hypothetical protein
MGLLTGAHGKSAERREKEYFLNDGDGLYLRVRLTAKVWIYRYFRDDKSVKLGLADIRSAFARTVIEAAIDAPQFAGGCEPPKRFVDSCASAETGKIGRRPDRVGFGCDPVQHASTEFGRVEDDCHDRIMLRFSVMATPVAQSVHTVEAAYTPGFSR